MVLTTNPISADLTPPVFPIIAATINPIGPSIAPSKKQRHPEFSCSSFSLDDICRCAARYPRWYGSSFFFLTMILFFGCMFISSPPSLCHQLFERLQLLQVRTLLAVRRRIACDREWADGSVQPVVRDIDRHASLVRANGSAALRQSEKPIRRASMNAADTSKDFGTWRSLPCFILDPLGSLYAELLRHFNLRRVASKLPQSVA